MEGGGSTSSLLPPLLNTSSQQPAAKKAPPKVPRINLSPSESHPQQVAQAKQHHDMNHKQLFGE